MAIDDFVIQYHLHTLKQRINNHEKISSDYFQNNDMQITSIKDNIADIQSGQGVSVQDITALKESFNSLQKQLLETNKELIKTKLINLKQEIVIRTVHNKDKFDAYDMMADTFTTGDSIDFVKSIRAAHFDITKSIGRTINSIAQIEQNVMTTKLHLANNENAEQGLRQTFLMDKKREMHQVSLFIEPFSINTYKPLVISIKDSTGAQILTQTSVEAALITTGWIDIDIPNIMLTANTEYILEISTTDVDGYKISNNNADDYLAGTCFSKFNNIWSNLNCDLVFKIWCYPSDDENNATIYTKVKTLQEIPTHIVFEKEDRLLNGTINYHISIDNGKTWKLLQAGISTDLRDITAGNQLILRANIEGDAQVDAWGYVVKRSEV